MVQENERAIDDMQSGRSGRSMDRCVIMDREPSRQIWRRSKLETSCDILRAIGSGINAPTRIMYKSNLSWMALQDHLQGLKRLGLIVEETNDGDKKTYRLTQNGFDVLRDYLAIIDDLRVC
jgi:predicted transcriptional regulator